MAGPLDHQLGIGLESAYGTAVTPTRFFEIDPGNVNHQHDPMVIQGTGMQVGDGGIGRADRTAAVGLGHPSGSWTMDLQVAGLGLLFNALFGNGVATAITGGSQQLFTSASTAALLPSHTCQLGVVRGDSGGTVDAFTYRGWMAKSFEITSDLESTTTLAVEWDALAQTTATALATASYPAGLAIPFHWGSWAITVGGSVTNPTTSALATGGTAFPDVKTWGWKWDRALDTERWTQGGGRLQPRAGRSEPELTLTTEYSGLTLDSALTGNTTLPVTITGTAASAVGAGFAQAQLTFPACKVTSPNRPGPSADTPTVDYTLAIKKPTSGAAIYAALRTVDTAL